MSGGEEPASRGAFPWHEPESWDTALQAMVRALTGLRRAHPALRRGAWRLRWQGEEAFAFSRVLGGAEIVVLVNRGSALHRVEVPVDLASPRVLWGEGRARQAAGGLVLEGIAAESGLVVGA